MENAHILRPFAIEYDYLIASLEVLSETKAINNLYFAGQINEVLQWC